MACQSLFHAVSPTDYEAVDVTLTFQPCDRQQCVNVSITDDLINEPEERFAVSLTLSDDNPPYVTLGSAGGIVITDDDGKDKIDDFKRKLISELCFIETFNVCVCVEVGREPWLLALVCVEFTHCRLCRLHEMVL